VASKSIKTVSSISLKPDSDGNVIATTDFSYNGALRIYDIRYSTSSNKCITNFEKVFLPLKSFRYCSISVPVVEENNLTGVYLASVMYSPADSSLIALAGNNGTRIIDTRTKRFLTVIKYEKTSFTIYLLIIQMRP